VVDFAQGRLRYNCSLPITACQICRCVAELLFLAPTPSSPVDAPMQTIASRPTWHLLSDEKAFQEVFDMFLLSFEDEWRGQTVKQGRLPHADTSLTCILRARQLVEEVLELAPDSSEAARELWATLRVQRQMALDAFENRREKGRPIVATSYDSAEDSDDGLDGSDFEEFVDNEEGMNALTHTHFTKFFSHRLMHRTHKIHHSSIHTYTTRSHFLFITSAKLRKRARKK